MRRHAYQEFTVPAGAGAYAPEIVYCSQDVETPDHLVGVTQAQDFVIALPATATLELQELAEDTDPTDDANWHAVASVNAVGLSALRQFVGSKLRYRAKSGGTGGTLQANLHWSIEPV